MYFTPLNVIFLLMLFSSSVFSMSSSTWLGAWVGLEINLMSFVPLAITSTGLKSSEGVLKYFLVQALSSLLLLFAIMMWVCNQVVLMAPPGANFMLVGAPMVALFIKLGAAPFHFWFPAVAATLGWHANFVMMTWQKIAPLILVYYLMQVGPLYFLAVISSSVVGAVGGLNEVSLRKIMAYSSINHLSWMLMASLSSPSLMMIYFWVYVVTALVLMMVMESLNLFYLSQVFYISSSPWLFIVFVNMFSFGGLPPFLGFMSKWMVLDYMTESGWYFMALTLVMFSLVSLFYYLRVAYAMFTQSTYWSPNSQSTLKAPLTILVCSMISITGMLVVPSATFLL